MWRKQVLKKLLAQKNASLRRMENQARARRAENDAMRAKLEVGSTGACQCVSESGRVLSPAVSERSRGWCRLAWEDCKAVWCVILSSEWMKQFVRACVIVISALVHGATAVVAFVVVIVFIAVRR